MAASQLFDAIAKNNLVVPGGTLDTAHGSFNVEGLSTTEADAPSANLGAVSGGYFAAMGIPLLSGRTFTRTDTSEAAPVAIVNATLACLEAASGDCGDESCHTRR